MNATHPFDVDQVDAFMAGPKQLDGQIPGWTLSSRPGELEARWNIIDPLGVRSHLRFRLNLTEPALPSVSVIFRRNAVTRLDIEVPTVCHSNPLWAGAIGLPPTVCGSHCHIWRDNRHHILTTGVWELPARRAVEPGLRRVPQMLPWIVELIGLDPLTPEQRDFDLPPKDRLL